MDFLGELNDEQRRAVEAPDGAVLIVAGPGTGKTKTLTARIVQLIASGRTRPDEILALTFTKKAAQEMQTRVDALLAGRPTLATGRPRISTFHALCHELLGGNLHFIEEPERLQLIKQLSRPAALKGLSARELGLLISRAKNGAEDNPALHQLVQAYDAELKQRAQKDFDDLLVYTLHLLQTDKAVRARVQRLNRFVLVDEFQDTNRLQYELLQLLQKTGNMFVIGDPLQSIYGFRGASGDIFAQFEHDNPHGQKITLHINYRSVPEVVILGNEIFRGAQTQEPLTQTPGRVRAVEVLNEYSEAAWVLSEIQHAIGGADMLSAVSDAAAIPRTLQDFAILYRSRAAATAMQKAIAESGLPYQVVGDGSPYDLPEVQAIIALMRAALSGDQPTHEGFSEAEWRAILEIIQQAVQASPSVLAEKIIATLGFEPKPALQQFVGNLVRFPDLAPAVAYFDTLAAQNFYDPSADAVTLLTIHASKGLEFPHVFLIGVEDGILPHTRAPNLARDEERRLFYVAVTRAKQNLDLVYTRHRAGKPATKSPYIAEQADHVLPTILDPNLEADQRRVQKRAIKRSQQTLF